MQDLYIDARTSRFHGPRSDDFQSSLVQVGFAYHQESDQNLAVVTIWEGTGRLVGDLYLTLAERDELVARLLQVPEPPRLPVCEDEEVE